MRHFYLNVTALAPLAIRADHAQGGAKTAPHIPGTTLLGGLAAAHRVLRENQETEFANLFLHEQVYFSHLYPAQFSNSTTGIHTSSLPVMPLPRTAQTCKRFSGFLPLPGEIHADQRHGIRDSLFDWTAFALLEQQQASPAALLASVNSYAECHYSNPRQPCKQLMDAIHGYYRCGSTLSERGTVQRMKAKLETRLQTRTGINRTWGVVEERILYNRQVFDDGMMFWGKVSLPDPLVDTFEDFLEEADNEELVHLGTGRTRGLGRVRIYAIEQTDVQTDVEGTKPDDIADFTQRLHTFNTKIRKHIKAAGVKQLDEFYLAVTLHAPTILCDPFKRYQNALDAATFSGLVDRASSGQVSSASNPFKPVYQSTAMERTTGWNELWGTPRANEYAIEAGSTFLFAYNRQPEEKLLQALFALEETGIGRRCAEGFGRIMISDPFHLQGEQG